MMPSINMGVEIPHDDLFFILVDTIHQDLRKSFKALIYFIIGIRVDRHVYYVELCIPYFYPYTPSLFQQIVRVFNDGVFNVLLDVKANSSTSSNGSFIILTYSLIAPYLDFILSL